MNATHSKTAAASTPGAEPAASQAEETIGANTAEQAGDLDIAGALGLPAEGQETDTDKAEVIDPDAEAEKPDEESDDPAGSEKAEDTPAEDEPGKSDDTEAKSDEAAEETGASEEKKETEPAAEEDAPAEGKTPAWAQKRFDELTAARRTAEDEARQLREQIATLKAAAAGAMQEQPLAFIDTPEQLADAQRDVEQLNQWAIRNRNGGKLGEKEYTADEVAQIEATTTAQLRSDLPARALYVQAKQRFDRAAVETYPWLNDTKQGAGATVQMVLEKYPQLRVLPNYRFMVANAFLANRLLEAGVVIDEALIARLGKEATAKKAGSSPAGAKPAAAAAKPAAPFRKPPPSPGRAGTMPARSTPRAAQVQAAEQRVTAANSSMDDLERSIAAKLS